MSFPARPLLVAFVTVAAAGMAFGQDSANPGPPKGPKVSTDELAAWIDEKFAAQWETAKFEPPPVVDDATFLKRTSLDLAGAIPTVSQAREFFEYSDDHKRGILVDRLLNETRRPEKFAERTAAHWANLWRRMMVPGNTPQAQMAVALEPWLKQQFVANVPYDEFARKLVTATSGGQAMMVATPNGPVASSSEPVVLYQAIGGKPANAASTLTRVFLGTRIGCAECHDHPFAPWKQQDFWGMAAFFSGVQNGNVADTVVAKITPENSTTVYVAKYLGGEEANIGSKTPRQALADWMVSPENKQFGATAVNRVWLYLMGRGMTDSVDDLDQATEAERQILDELAAKFVESGYDVRWLIAGICKSKVYQRECASPDDAENPTPIGVRVVKTLSPEQLFDSLERALALPVSSADGAPRFNGLRTQLIARMNEAASNDPGDYRAGIPQALLLMNGQLTAEATDLDQSRTLRGVLEAPFLGTEEKLDTLYLAVFTRTPRDEEREYLLEHVRKQSDDARQKQAYAEIFWGLLNSPEFVLER